MVKALRNKKIVENFVNEFIKRNYETYMNYLADDIKWNIVGMPPINGKQNFLEVLEMMEVWPSSKEGINTSSGAEKNIIAEGDFVVIENQNYSLNREISSNPAHCDIYRISKGKIKEVTTYIVDTSMNE